MNIEEESLKRFKKEMEPETSSCECFFHYPDDKVFEVGFKHGVEAMIEIINSKIKEFEGGEAMKSMNEMFKDRSIVEVLEKIKINE